MSWSSIKRAALTIGAGMLFAHGLAAYTLRDRMMTREVPDSACTLPSPASIFPTSADRANIWFAVNAVAATDEFAYEWLDPAGAGGGQCYRAG